MSSWTVLMLFFTSYLHKLLRWDQYQPIDSPSTISAQLPLLSNATSKESSDEHILRYILLHVLFPLLSVWVTAVHGLQSKGKKNIGKWCRLSTYKMPLEKSKVEFRKKFKIAGNVRHVFQSKTSFDCLHGPSCLVFLCHSQLFLNLDKSNWRFINPVLFLSAVMTSWLWHAKCHFERKSYFNNSVDFHRLLCYHSHWV